MFSKNDLNLLKLAINFAKESVDDSVEHLKNMLDLI